METLNIKGKAENANLLNGLLADHFTLLLKVWQFHWNVVGPSFGSYHEDFKELYEAEFERVDSVAERIRALGATPLGSMEAMLQKNHIFEHTSQTVPSAMEMWKVINDDWHEVIQVIHSIHSQITEEDIATKSLLENMAEEMEKEAWMIHSRLE